MEKAYELKVLIEKLKVHGVEVAEEGAKAILLASFEYLEESAALSSNKVDDMLVPFYPIVKKYALEMAENINKEDNV